MPILRAHAGHIGRLGGPDAARGPPVGQRCSTAFYKYNAQQSINSFQHREEVSPSQPTRESVEHHKLPSGFWGGCRPTLNFVQSVCRRSHLVARIALNVQSKLELVDHFYHNIYCIFSQLTIAKSWGQIAYWSQLKSWGPVPCGTNGSCAYGLC